MNKFLVVVVDVGDYCDGHARALGLYDTYKEAKAFVEEDMEQVRDTYLEDDEAGAVAIDYAKLEVWADAHMSTGSMWDIIDLGKVGK